MVFLSVFWLGSQVEHGVFLSHCNWRDSNGAQHPGGEVKCHELSPMGEGELCSAVHDRLATQLITGNWSCMHNLLDMVQEMCPLGFYWLWCATAQHRAFVTLPSQLLYLQNLSFLKRLLSMQSFHFSISTYTAFDRNDRNGRACLAFKSQTLKQRTVWSFFFLFFKKPTVFHLLGR